MTPPIPPPPSYRWEPGYQAYYHNPGCEFHGHKVILAYPDPCGHPGWSVKFAEPEPGWCDGMAVDEKRLWIYG